MSVWFTCETKADLGKHTSEVHSKDCAHSRHGEGRDKSENSVEELKMRFFCPFQCGFSNEDEDLFLIDMTVNHEFSQRPPSQSNYETCHLCTFYCTTKNELAKHTSDVHQNGQKVDNMHDNHIISQVKADKKGLSHVKFKQMLAANGFSWSYSSREWILFPVSSLHCLLLLVNVELTKIWINLSIEVMNEIRNNM